MCQQKQNDMEVAIKKQTAFRLNSDLLDRLKMAAKREHRSLNNYVESLLMEIMYNEPNEVTRAAMEEARLDQNLKNVDTSSFENFILDL
ncbi:MAG: toxin-antitoxin system HicB family antitoxin [Parabacteroides sp.]|nr:toxin-antitoxin system HicB family antitoxin [bacterium]MDD7722346.1 toxin-antitoxin system HicB family antitoxin [bacterium]MDY5638892.1 toxin-antitoxin system HicB family antitoxin [Parabacteroides sp.]MDY6004194.1 toxin-antitoxin system HicB family antitoxin [Parabacteroides sp.]